MLRNMCHWTRAMYVVYIKCPIVDIGRFFLNVLVKYNWCRNAVYFLILQPHEFFIVRSEIPSPMFATDFLWLCRREAYWHRCMVLTLSHLPAQPTLHLDPLPYLDSGLNRTNLGTFMCVIKVTPKQDVCFSCCCGLSDSFDNPLRMFSVIEITYKLNKTYTDNNNKGVGFYHRSSHSLTRWR